MAQALPSAGSANAAWNSLSCNLHDGTLVLILVLILFETVGGGEAMLRLPGTEAMAAERALPLLGEAGLYIVHGQPVRYSISLVSIF